MNALRDLGLAVLGAVLLLFGLNVLAQCSSAAHRTETEAVSAPAPSRPSEEEAQSNRTRTGGASAADEKEDEERARIKNFAHALQTIGSNPEYRKTLGVPP